MAKRCKYGKLKSPYRDKNGVKRTCRKRPRKAAKRRRR